MTSKISLQYINIRPRKSNETSEVLLKYLRITTYVSTVNPFTLDVNPFTLDGELLRDTRLHRVET